MRRLILYVIFLYSEKSFFKEEYSLASRGVIKEKEGGVQNQEPVDYKYNSASGCNRCRVGNPTELIVIKCNIKTDKMILSLLRVFSLFSCKNGFSKQVRLVGRFS